MRGKQSCFFGSYSFLLGLLGLWVATCLPAFSQQAESGFFFPRDEFTQINPTLPNERLNFEDDSQESCCAKDYGASGQPIGSSSDRAAASEASTNRILGRSEFERANPRYLQNSTPAHMVSCERLADFPEQAANMTPSANFNDRSGKNTLPIVSYSTNVSQRRGADYFSDPKMKNTSDFHVQTIGGDSQVRLQDVRSYSICMARGNNVAMLANTEDASIMTYNGSDHLYLSGNNINMFVRTGSGEDLIELYQASPSATGVGYTAFNIYKTAISGGSDTDTLVIKGTPQGTKWCHIGGYRLHGEYFYVVEFALPPSVTEGPRRQRVNIGESMENITIKGKTYRLNDFLVHGEPVDTVASSIPIGDALPRVAIRFPNR
ncbi:hypothetical protein [Vampirovibrio sp.]|uniref:hypothetical protein n=1 Tax=Vampirovibrio sp. TaxID=2717857 RepID=UPI0035933950